MRFALCLLIAAALPAFADNINPRFEKLLKTESEDIARIRRGILFIQNSNAAAAGVKRRGTHAKGVCARATFDVLDLPADSKLKVGMFAAPASYATVIRFANAEGKVQADQEPDVRAVSLQVSVPDANPQGQMDFAMNNAPIFPINDAHAFADLMTVAEFGILSGGWEIGVGGLIGLQKAKDIGKNQSRPASAPYQWMTYWSDVPFQLGDDQAVKYALRPCMSNPGLELTKDPDTLSLEFKRHVKEDEHMSCFDFQIQTLDTDKMTDSIGFNYSASQWVENATWEWNEEQAPFVTVARVTLVENSALEDADCERTSVDVTRNNNSTHRGLGSINRARAAGERASAENR